MANAQLPPPVCLCGHYNSRTIQLHSIDVIILLLDCGTQSQFPPYILPPPAITATPSVGNDNAPLLSLCSVFRTFILKSSYLFSKIIWEVAMTYSWFYYQRLHTLNFRRSHMLGQKLVLSDL